jgi:hypothetical protein
MAAPLDVNADLTVQCENTTFYIRGNGSAIRLEFDTLGDAWRVAKQTVRNSEMYSVRVSDIHLWARQNDITIFVNRYALLGANINTFLHRLLLLALKLTGTPT